MGERCLSASALMPKDHFSGRHRASTPTGVGGESRRMVVPSARPRSRAPCPDPWPHVLSFTRAHMAPRQARLARQCPWPVVAGVLRRLLVGADGGGGRVRRHGRVQRRARPLLAPAVGESLDAHRPADPDAPALAPGDPDGRGSGRCHAGKPASALADPSVEASASLTMKAQGILRCARRRRGTLAAHGPQPATSDAHSGDAGRRDAGASLFVIALGLGLIIRRPSSPPR